MPGDKGGFELIAAGIYLEGLAVDRGRDVVWYSDVIAGGVHGVTREGAEIACLNPERRWTGGIMMNEDGAVLSSGAGGIMWNHPETGGSGWLIDRIAGQPVNGINEMMPDGGGGIVFGTVDLEMIAAGKPARPAAIYRLATNGETTLLAEGLGFANGIMISADRRLLFYNDTFDAAYAYDLAADLSLSNRRLLLEKEDCDGMALDADGTLWLTGFRSGQLDRVRPDGGRLAPVATPAAAISQVRFGGADMRDLYITSVPAQAGDTLKEGGRLTRRDSILYRGRAEVAGMPIAPARFALR